VFLLFSGQKVIAVADGLHEDEGPIQNQRGRAGEDELGGAVQGSDGREGEIRQHQRERDERRQHGESRVRALRLESLLVVTHAADEQAEADQPVTDDHDGSEHRVSRQARAIRPPTGHNGNDQCRLDHRHREGEDKCAKRFAYAKRHHLGVVDGRKYRGYEHDSGDG
jgi:uncharacterized protein involved in type VI secretion and phage assembly